MHAQKEISLGGSVRKFWMRTWARDTVIVTYPRVFHLAAWIKRDEDCQSLIKARIMLYR